VPAVAALLDTPAALTTLRRGLSRERLAVVACRNPAGLRGALADRPVDAIVVGSQVASKVGLAELRARFPAIPILAYGVFRADDAELLLSWHRMGVAAVAVEGVDDPVLADLVARHTPTARRRQGLREAPQALRLTEPIQVAAWAILMEEPGRAVDTAALAHRLHISREHLSRQFGAGGAPNLKRVIDFLRVVGAADLAANPGYTPADIARLTGFASQRHLRATVLRVSGTDLEVLGAGGVAEVLGRFVRVGMRSRA